MSSFCVRHSARRFSGVSLVSNLDTSTKSRYVLAIEEEARQEAAKAEAESARVRFYRSRLGSLPRDIERALRGVREGPTLRLRMGWLWIVVVFASIRALYAFLVPLAASRRDEAESRAQHLRLLAHREWTEEKRHREPAEDTSTAKSP